MISIFQISEILLLILISKQPSHSYQIEKFINEIRPGRNYHIPRSSIYTLIKKLQQKGLISSETIPQKNAPPRKILSITPLGKEYLRRQIITLIQENNHPPFEVLFLNLSLFSRVELLEIMENHIEKIKTEIQKRFELISSKDAGLDQGRTLLIYRELTFLQAERKWSTEFIQQI